MGDPLGSSRVSSQKQNHEGVVEAPNGQYRARDVGWQFNPSNPIPVELMVKLAKLCGYSIELRCPLPNADLETLISVKSNEDLANIIEEYGRASSPSHPLKIIATSDVHC
ncbi:hypothetical protein ACFX13_013502 [Malus domestica]|uniref:PB1 domain-containing protein n=1 Tax=Malus domestica TaxID=3750 RepID=A0A498I9X0_MALDO|nr:hypothetical protein DVH24_002283 [Malus domestica]